MACIQFYLFQELYISLRFPQNWVFASKCLPTSFSIGYHWFQIWMGNILQLSLLPFCKIWCVFFWKKNQLFLPLDCWVYWKSFQTWKNFLAYEIRGQLDVFREHKVQNGQTSSDRGECGLFSQILSVQVLQFFNLKPSSNHFQQRTWTCSWLFPHNLWQFVLA